MVVLVVTAVAFSPVRDSVNARAVRTGLMFLKAMETTV
jgi:hypothetical protein